MGIGFKQMKNPSRYFLGTILVLCTCLWTAPATAAPSADLWPFWQTAAAESTERIDHSPWDALLSKYLVTDHSTAINRFKYAAVSDEDQQSLNMYLVQLQQIRVRELNRSEQKAFWINLYNALTVKVILDHYPVKSIMDVDISPGFFSNGPWDAKLLTIEGESLSLNDIEHRILRPIFADNRVHYALNCASLGCPNLQAKAFTTTNLEQLLDEGATSYINHARGAQLHSNKLQVSSIYKWFQADFGNSHQQIIAHLQQYAQGDLARLLKTYNGKLSFSYNWDLNE